jgi:2-methylcitrate dehydratase PrpD
LRNQYQLQAQDVSKVVVKGNPLLRQRTDRKRPRSGREAQVSLQHTAAVCFLYGAAGIPQYSDACAAESAVAEFGNKVEIVDDAAIPAEAAEVTLSMRDGRSLTHKVAQALGSFERPMSDAQLEAKARELAAFGAPHCDIGGLIDDVWSIEQSKDASTLITKCT